MAYQANNYLNFSAQYLHGSQISLTAKVNVNPIRPPLPGGRELAPVPMRTRSEGLFSVKQSNEETIRRVLTADQFKVHRLSLEGNIVNVVLTNQKFRSTAQAIGRVASTLQRFTADDIKFADISFYDSGMQTASYRVNLVSIIEEQLNPNLVLDVETPIKPFDPKPQTIAKEEKVFRWGLGPYFAHRLFNPDLPLSMETGLEVKSSYHVTQSIKLSANIRKSVLTNLTKNKRGTKEPGRLPRVQSDWRFYDLEGQSGHIHALNLSYQNNLAPGLYGRLHAGLLEPFFAGVGAEVLYKPAHWPIGIGFDIHRVRKRDYDMRFDLLDYETTVGHLSLYYDAGGMFDFEVNAGRYLAGDWGATTTISRKFGSGWEVGGYATFTDVPFEEFGEGSFDKAIYVSIPIDWIISSPDRTKRRLTIRPITRDGGAQLSSARRLYREIENFQNSSVKREIGRLWK